MASLTVEHVMVLLLVKMDNNNKNKCETVPGLETHIF
jgi:hypothetical protein